MPHITSVLDLTGNVGTESIFFTKHFKSITRTDINEYDKNTYKDLVDNVRDLPDNI